MNEDLNPLSLSAICVGCLSSDRKLKCLSNEDTVLFLHEFLDCFDNTQESVLLCWECIALVQKTVNFKRQVKHARDCLTRSLYNHTPLTTLSRLKIKNTHQLHIIEDSSPKKKTRKSKIKKTHTETHVFKNNIVVSNLDILDNFKKDSSVRHESTEKYDSSIQIEWQNEVKIDSDFCETKNNDSIQKYDYNTFSDVFVKCEDSDDLDMDVDGYIINENVDNRVSENLKEIKVDMSENAKAKRLKRKQNVAYDDSDDEPLVKKKEGKSKKKRKKTDTSPAVARRREKPAGVVSSPRVMKKLQELNVSPDQLQMVLLSWTEVEEERQRSLESDTFTRHEYRCYDCVLGFNYRVKLENHMRKHNPSAGDLVCEVCKIHCKNAHALSAHRRRHRVRWRCVSCGGRWSRAGVAADHLARAHGSAAHTHLCTVCGHTDTSLGRLRNHMKNHSERQKCELCDKTFRNKDSLRTHLFIHRGEKEYQCPKCEKKFLFKRALHVHMITHDAPALLYCHECDMNFKNRMSYGQHMRYSLKHVDPAKLKHACAVCDKRFLKAARLEEHNMAVHLKATPFRCALQGCDFASSSRAVLRSHARLVHRGGRARRNYVCHTCGKAYKNKKTLEGHLRSHSGERPLRCEHCPATFGYDAALYNHNKLVHLNRKIRSSRPSAPEET